MLPVSLSAIGEDSRLSCEAGRRNWQTWQTHALGLHHRFSSLKLLKHVVSVVAVAILVLLRCEQLAGEGQEENAWSTARSVQISFFFLQAGEHVPLLADGLVCSPQFAHALEVGTHLLVSILLVTYLKFSCIPFLVFPSIFKVSPQVQRPVGP